MEHTAILENGRVVTIRSILPEDMNLSFAFFKALPEEDRKYLRRDVTRYSVVRRRIELVERGRMHILIALAGGEIVADGTLELANHGWGDNIAEIRLIIARPWQRHGLGTKMARELFMLAAEHRVDRVVVRMMRPQKGARHIFRKLGFQDEFVLPKHVRDQSGEWQDMVIMRCNLEDLWQDMEGMTSERDWVLHR
ncbi:MAG: GNAT family N-acetyltransferase [Planctomycetota bacterium]